MGTTLTELEIKAQKWLKKTVAENTNRSDFKIIRTNSVTTTEKNTVFEFLCSYNWQLNSWIKEVETTIFVSYNHEKSIFVTPMV